jgi:RND family efflux transporter MFP subunit
VIAELEDLGYGATAIAELLAVGDPHPTLEVRAPCDGVILELSVARHGWVRSYEPLLTLGNPETLELELQIPPDDAAGVTAGDAVEFVPVGRPQAAGRARVITGVPQVDPTTRTVTVRAALEEALRPRQLLPGVFVEGTLTRGRPSRGAAVPEAAVIRLGARDHVFVHRSAGTFEARPVTLGRYTAGTWEVIDGVTVGEQVAVSGVFLLKSALLRAGEEEG